MSEIRTEHWVLSRVVFFIAYHSSMDSIQCQSYKTTVLLYCYDQTLFFKDKELKYFCMCYICA